MCVSVRMCPSLNSTASIVWKATRCVWLSCAVWEEDVGRETSRREPNWGRSSSERLVMFICFCVCLLRWGSVPQCTYTLIDCTDSAGCFTLGKMMGFQQAQWVAFCFLKCTLLLCGTLVFYRKEEGMESNVFVLSAFAFVYSSFAIIRTYALVAPLRVISLISYLSCTCLFRAWALFTLTVWTC